MSRLRGVLALGLLALVATVSGCQKEAPPPPPPPAAPMPPPPPPPPPPPFKVDSMDVGKAVGVDNQLTSPTASFGPKDTIYLSVISEGVAPAVAYRAKWTYGPKALLVKEESQSIASLGPRATEFHISKPSGWPLGKYKVELFVNDTSTGVKEFEVVAAKAPVKKKK